MAANDALQAKYRVDLILLPPLPRHRPHLLHLDYLRFLQTNLLLHFGHHLHRLPSLALQDALLLLSRKSLHRHQLLPRASVSRLDEQFADEAMNLPRGYRHRSQTPPLKHLQALALLQHLASY